MSRASAISSIIFAQLRVLMVLVSVMLISGSAGASSVQHDTRSVLSSHSDQAVLSTTEWRLVRLPDLRLALEGGGGCLIPQASWPEPPCDPKRVGFGPTGSDVPVSAPDRHWSARAPPRLPDVIGSRPF